MGRRWRMGIIGCGWAGQQHARAMGLLPDRVELRAVADADAQVAEAKAREWRTPMWTTDYRQLLAEPLDAVSICLPHSLHAEAAIAAAERGLHILLEKPLATSLREADSMIAAAHRAGVTLMVAENVRFSDTYRKAAELVRSGAVGEVFLLRIAREHQMHEYLRQRPWFLSEATGGIMCSGGVHDFELLRMLGGEISHVYALPGRKVLPEMAADDTSVAVVGMQSGAAAVIVESFSLRTPVPGVQGSVHGSEGSLWFGAGWIRTYSADTDGRTDLVGETKIARNDTFQAEMEHFLDCLDDHREPITSGREQRKPLAAVVAAYRSIETGRRVYIADVTS